MAKGKVRFVYRHLAFLGPESVRAAEASECAAEQGRFWEYHDTLFEHWAGENQGAFSDANLVRFAQALGLDVPSFRECLRSERYAGRVAQDLQEARRLGVRATPTVIVDGLRLQGLKDYDTYRRAIEEALARSR